jgi:hypothetical protein
METELARLERLADDRHEICVERCMERDIEAENAALWAFVRANDAYWMHTIFNKKELAENLAVSRETLCDYEDKS